MVKGGELLMKNPMNRRFLRELKADLGKYLVIFLFITMVVSVVSSFLVANTGINKVYYDNLEKNLLDILTRLRFWEDDAHVFTKSTAKVWGPTPYLAIAIKSQAKLYGMERA